MKYRKLQEKIKKCKNEFQMLIRSHVCSRLSEINDYQTLITIAELTVTSAWLNYLFDEIEIQRLYSTEEIEIYFIETWLMYWRTTQNTIFDIFNNAVALPNLFMLEMADTIFGHRKGIDHLLRALEIPYLIDVEFLGIKRTAYKIHPEFKISAKRNNNKYHAEFNFMELIYSDGHLLHVPSLAPCFSHRLSAMETLAQINQINEGLINKLSTHNADIAQIVFKYINIYSAPIQALKNLSNSLIQSGEKFTHQSYTTFETSAAIELFFNYLNLLPEEMQINLLAIKSAYNPRFTLTWVLHEHLAQGRCVETAASIIEQIIENRNNHQILNTVISLPDRKNNNHNRIRSQTISRNIGCVHENFYKKQPMPAALPEQTIIKVMEAMNFNDDNHIDQLLILLQITPEENLQELIDEAGRNISSDEELILIIIQLELDRMRILIQRLADNGHLLHLFKYCYENDSINHIVNRLSPDYRIVVMQFLLPLIVKKVPNIKAFLRIHGVLSNDEKQTHFTLALSRLSKKIETADEYYLLASDCNEAQKAKLLDAMMPKVSLLIRTIDDYLLIKNSSPSFMLDALFVQITPLLSACMNTCNDYAKLIANANKQQRHTIHDVLKFKISTLITNYYSFILYCRSSTTAEITWLFHQIKQKIPSLVESAQDYINFSHLLPFDCQNEFNILMRDKLINLSRTMAELLVICKYLPKQDQLFLLWVMNYTGQLHKIIVSIDELEKIIFKIEGQSERERFLCVTRDNLANHAVKITQRRIHQVSQTELGQLIFFSDKIKISRRIMIDAAKRSGDISSTAVMSQLQGR